jgi:DNA-binding transcriptional ArsR family regulator
MGCPYKAIGDDTRRKILEMLNKGEMNAGAISEHFNSSWPAISNHLKILKEANLVVERKEGKNRVYSLNKKAIEGVTKFLGSLA